MPTLSDGAYSTSNRRLFAHWEVCHRKIRLHKATGQVGFLVSAVTTYRHRLGRYDNDDDELYLNTLTLTAIKLVSTMGV